MCGLWTVANLLLSQITLQLTGRLLSERQPSCPRRKPECRVAVKSTTARHERASQPRAESARAVPSPATAASVRARRSSPARAPPELRACLARLQPGAAVFRRCSEVLGRRAPGGGGGGWLLEGGGDRGHMSCVGGVEVERAGSPVSASHEPAGCRARR